MTLRPFPVKSCWRPSPNSRVLFWSCRLQLRHSRRSSPSCSSGLRPWKERPSPAAPGECLASSPKPTRSRPSPGPEEAPAPRFLPPAHDPHPTGGACPGLLPEVRLRIGGRLGAADPGRSSTFRRLRPRPPSMSLSPASVPSVSNAGHPRRIWRVWRWGNSGWGSTWSA